MPSNYSRKTSLALISLLAFLERFSYYGIYSSFFFYLIEQDRSTFNLSLTDVLYYRNFLIIGISISALLLGLLIDLVLKQEKAIFVGGAISILSYACLLIPNELFIIPSLIALIIGVNLVKPSLTILVGKLFNKEDNKRDLGYMLFFVFINLGAFLSSSILGIYVIGVGWGGNLLIPILISSTLLYLIIFYIIRNKLPFIEEGLNGVKSFFPKKGIGMASILDADASNRLTIVEIDPLDPSHKKSKPFLLILIVITLIALYTNLKAIGNESYWDYLTNNSGNLSLFGAEISELPLSSLTFILWLVFNLILFILWYFIGVGSTFRKLNLSFLFLAIGALCIYLIMESTEPPLSYWVIPLLFIELSEILIMPIALSYITRLSKVKYATTILGFYTLCIYLSTLFFNALLGSSVRSEWLLLTIIALFLLVVLLFAFRKQLLNLSNGLD